MSGVLEQSLTHDYWLSNVSPGSPESLLLSSKINEKKSGGLAGNGARVKLDVICEMEQSVTSIQRQVYA